MGYCTESDILADFKAIEIAASGTVVSTAEVGKIIEEQSAYIDGIIGLRYVTPVDTVTYPKAGYILRMICVSMCGERIKNILQVKPNVIKIDTEVKNVPDGVRSPKYDLQMISKGLLLLPDAPKISAGGGFSSFNSDNGLDFVINTGKQQW